MEITYKYDVSKNYMILNGNEYDNADFEITMVFENKIAGLLELNKRSIDNKVNIQYDISSKQSLAVLYEKKKMTMEDLKNLVIELSFCIANIKNYLLDFNNIILKPETIFIDISSLKYFFCYYPYIELDFRKQMDEYFDYVITKIDYQDSDAVKLAYDMQKIVKKENFIIKDLLDLLNDSKMEELSKTEDERDFKPENKGLEILQNDKSKCIVHGIFEKGVFLALLFGEAIWMIIYQKTHNDFIKKIILAIIISIAAYTVYFVFKNLKKIKKQSRENENKNFSQENNTIIEADVENSVLKCINEKNIQIQVNEGVMYVGSLPQRVDFVIKGAQVSEIHARITMENQICYIEDLNSEKGTYINNVRLNPYEKIYLDKGDIIKFALIEYKYV